MAKIYVSALLNRISGRLGDAVYATTKGVAYVRAMSTTFVDPASAQQKKVRKNFGDLSTAYVNLSDAEKDLWREWANLKGRKGGPRASFVSVNGNLLNASHSDLVAINSPARTPGTPKFPKHFCVTVLSATQVCLQWSEPVDQNTYVTGHFKLDRWFCGNHPCWELCPTTGYSWCPRSVKTVRGDAAAIQHVHGWPASTKLYYWLNSIDKCGRKSPVTHAIKVTTPA